MNRKYLFAGVAAAALAVPVALAALPAYSQEAAPKMRMFQQGPNGQRFGMVPNEEMRQMIQEMQAQGRERMQQQMRPNQPQARGGDERGPQGRGPMMGPQAQRAPMMPPRPATNPLERYDTNKDGATTQAEVDAVRGDRLKQFDRNNDGKLNLEEYAALWLDAYRRQMVDQFQGHDDDGDGQVTIEEFNENFANLVRRNDRNGDGKVDATDVARPQVAPGQPAAPGTPTMVPGMRPQQGGARPI